MSTKPVYAELNDDLSDLLGNTERKPRELPTDDASVRMRAMVELHKEQCPKCRGTGRFTSYSGRVLGECFTCKGRGHREYKNDAATRQRARDGAAARKVRAHEQAMAAFDAAHPDVRPYLAARAASWPFAGDLLGKLEKYGSLTDGQILAVQKAMARDETRDAERAAAKAARDAAALVIDTTGVDRLKAAFDKAIAAAAEKGLRKYPRITINGVTISPAKPTSRNPGALYVKGDDYLGKIDNGKFYPTRECTPELVAQVQAFMANPAEAAKVYGQTTGTCCICNATLRSEWKFKGIGPICAEKFGF